MVDKSEKIFEIGGPIILSDFPSENSSSISEHLIAVSEEVPICSRNGNFALLRCYGDARRRKMDWSTKQTA